MEHPESPFSQSAPIDENDLHRISSPVAIADQRSAFPDICVDSLGAVWVTWVQTEANEESVLATSFTEDASFANKGHEQPLQLSAQPGINLQPCIISLGHGSVRVFWVHKNETGWQLLTRSIHGRVPGDIAVVLDNKDGVFRPRATRDAEGICWVAVETASGSTTRVLVCKQTGNSWKPVFESEGEADRRPDLCTASNGDIYLLFDSRNGATSAIIANRFPAGAATDSPERIVICDDGYINVHPAATRGTTSGIWITFASNRNQAAKDPAWLTKWSYLFHLDDGRQSKVVAPRPGIDVYNEHAFQGWEFPSIATTSSGAVAIAGQSAHSLLFQYCSENQWSDVLDLDEPRWGSWKPQTRMASKGDTIYIMSMGLGGVQLSEVSINGASNDLIPLTESGQDRASSASTSIKGLTSARPSLQSPDDEQLNYYFGDLHGHSVYSDACGDVDEFYHRYRDIYAYDFAALTEHDYLDGIELSESELALLWNNAARFSEDDEFIAWFAYEWTSPAISVHASETDSVGEGHRHILYPDDTGPLVRYGDPSSNTGKKLLEQLKDVKALVIPHHTAWSGTDWEAHDPELQKVVEIVSTHGRFEFAGNNPIGYRRDHLHSKKFVLDALDKGYKLGFVGGSDSHGLRWHAIELDGRAEHIEEGTRVGWKEDAYRTGMTVILAPELTRSSLFEALQQRRCYATSGVPIILDFRVNDSIMGTEISTDAPPLLTVDVRGVGALRSVEIARSGHTVTGLQLLPGAPIDNCSFEFVDESLIPGESVYYYLRVIQEDGNMAWSSPIWVTHE